MWIFLSTGQLKNSALVHQTLFPLEVGFGHETKRHNVCVFMYMHRVAQVSTHQLHVEMVHRPASNNVGVKASIDRLEMTGWSSMKGKPEDAPTIITTEKEEAGVCVCACVYVRERERDGVRLMDVFY